MSQTQHRIGVFVDVQNIYYTTKAEFGRPFNYRAFWQFLEQQGEITTAIAYAVRSNDDSQIKFQDALRHIGFDVKLKNFIQRKDGSTKADWDVGITIDIMEQAANLDEIILVSGDGDFAILLKHVMQKHRVKTTACGVKNLSANELINTCTTYHAIENRWLIS